MHEIRQYTQEIHYNGKHYRRQRTNAYINVSVLHDPCDITVLFYNNASFLIRTDIADVDQLVLDLIEYNKEHPCQGEKKNVSAYHMQFLLPGKLEDTVLYKLIDALSDYFEGANYFAYTSKAQKARYLEIVFLNKHYYPKGVNKPILATSTKTVDPVTRRLCPKGTEGGIVIQRKGDVLGYKVSKFSTNIQSFIFSKASFDYFMDNLKVYYFKQLSKFADIEIVDGVSFTKITQKGRIWKQQKAASSWNYIFSGMENIFNSAYNGLKEAKIEITSKVKHEIDKIYHRYITILRKGNFAYAPYSKRKKVKWDIYTEKGTIKESPYLLDYQKALLDKFCDEVTETFKKIHYSCA